MVSRPLSRARGDRAGSSSSRSMPEAAEDRLLGRYGPGTRIAGDRMQPARNRESPTW